MSLSDLASLGSLVSGLAVLGSLIYLNIQTRQATKHQRSLMMQGRAARTTELALRRADSSFASGWEKVEMGVEALSHFELFQMLSVAEANFISIEETWLESREGLQSKATHDVTMRRIARMFSVPIFRAVWPQYRLSCDPEFMAVADQIFRETRSASRTAMTDTYRQALAAELPSRPTDREQCQDAR
jgi:hypothetical protein